MQNTVEGYVDHIIFRNEDNGYTVLNLMVNGSELTCVGIFEYIGEGELLELTGTYVEHSTYGQQFKVESYETKIPEDTIAIERYLGSGAIKGVGAALAARIVRRFGEDTMRILDEEPERLAEVKGISERKAREIAQQAAEKSEMRSAMMFLQKYGQMISRESDSGLLMRLRGGLEFIQILIIGLKVDCFILCLSQHRKGMCFFRRIFYCPGHRSFWEWNRPVWKNTLWIWLWIEK